MLCKSENVTQGIHENSDVDYSSINKHVLRGFDSNDGDNHGWFPKSIPHPKVGTRNFYGKDPIMWIFLMEIFFYHHLVPNL